MATNISATLTPSEVTAVHADAFAPQQDGGFPCLLRPELAVEYSMLAHRMLIAALLANEAAGALRLEMGRRKAWLGLRTVTSLFAHLGSGDPGWPAGSWEERMLRQVQRLAPKGKNDVHKVMYGAIGSPSVRPEEEAVEATLPPLRTRGLVEEVTTQRTALKFIRVKEKHDALTAAGEQAAREEGAESTQMLLERCQRERPEIFQALMREVARAFAWRKRSDDVRTPD